MDPHTHVRSIRWLEISRKLSPESTFSQGSYQLLARVSDKNLRVNPRAVGETGNRGFALSGSHEVHRQWDRVVTVKTASDCHGFKAHRLSGIEATSVYLGLVLANKAARFESFRATFYGPGEQGYIGARSLITGRTREGLMCLGMVHMNRERRLPGAAAEKHQCGEASRNCRRENTREAFDRLRRSE